MITKKTPTKSNINNHWCKVLLYDCLQPVGIALMVREEWEAELTENWFP